MKTTPIKERPILMSAPMVRAILRDKDPKTQTRRIVKTDLRPQSEDTYMRGFPLDPQNVRMCGDYAKCDAPAGARSASYRVRCPYGSAIQQDRLWVREAWRADEDHDGPYIYYAADGTRDYGLIELAAGMANPYITDKETCRPSIHLPRWASRITLEIESVRVERLQDISVEDAKAEGCNGNGHYYRAYCDLWESINGKGSWALNPWVWAITFRRLAVTDARQSGATRAAATRG